MVLEQLDIHMQKNELTHTSHFIQMGHRPKYKILITKLPKETIEENLIQ